MPGQGKANIFVLIYVLECSDVSWLSQPPDMVSCRSYRSCQSHQLGITIQGHI
jgi:hypothetical protein